MTKFKVGDRVRVTESCDYRHSEGLEVGTEFQVTEVKDPNDYTFPCRAKRLSEGFGSTSEGILFREDELERIPELDDDRFPVGTRVRCTNDSNFQGREGTVTRLMPHSNRYHQVTWDGDSEPGGGVWNKGALELIEDQPEPEVDSRIELLENTLKEVHWVLMYYHDQHLAKGTDDALYKAMFNHMVADRIANALAEK